MEPPPSEADRARFAVLHFNADRPQGVAAVIGDPMEDLRLIFRCCPGPKRYQQICRLLSGCVRGTMCFEYAETIISFFGCRIGVEQVVRPVINDKLREPGLGLPAVLPLGWLVRHLPQSRHRMQYFVFVANMFHNKPGADDIVGACARNFALVLGDSVGFQLTARTTAILSIELGDRLAGAPQGVQHEAQLYLAHVYRRRLEEQQQYQRQQ
jgi:hypothetical protein